jgi:hypothetical protein
MEEQQHRPAWKDEIRKTANMPPGLWKQIEARLHCYEPKLDFADWSRRIFQYELKRPPRVLGDWLAQPKEPARDQNLKQAPSSHKAELLAALDRAYDRLAIEAPGNDAESIETLRKLFGELERILGKPETWTTKLE